MTDTKTSQLGNKYILLDLIGVGGMAEVYRCKLLGRQGFEKIIVLKKLLDQASQDRETVENFINEARLAALLQHENIAHIYDFGEIEGSYFIAMEYLFGKDLHSLMQRAKEAGSIIQIKTALVVASEICSGMQYAHTLKDLQQRPLNIIHRDLSPHNVFITYDGRAKIIDFGVAKAELFDHRTRVGVVKGKISYMSPEQLTEDHIDHRSDIYSIGILVYEMLCGRKMYVGDTASLIRKCMQGQYEKLEVVRPDLPARVCAIVNRALEFDRECRYQSCAEMRHDIETYLHESRSATNEDILREYMANLFGDDYEAEKSKLYSTTRKFDKIYGADDEEKTQVTSYYNGPASGTVFVDAPNTLTVVSEKPGALLPVKKGWYESFVSLTPFKKSALIASLVVVSMLVIQVSLHHEEKDLALLAVLENTQQQKEDNGLDVEDDKVAQTVGKPENAAAVQLEVFSLFKRADALLAESDVTSNELTEAAGYYQRVLELRQEEDRAKDGLKRIAEKYADLAERDLRKKHLIGAEWHIEKGLQYAPANGRLLTIYSLVEQEKGRIIEQLAWKAKNAMERNDLTTPEDDCAFMYYREILKIDKNNRAAWRGMYSIADRYAEFAEKSFRNLNLKKAHEYVDRGLKVISNHKRLLAIKTDLSRSAPGIFFQVMKRNYDVLTE